MQWLYFGYLAGVKEQNGAAMSLGRTSTFLDIYFERDLAAGTLDEEQAQEIIDDFVIKLRIVRFLRTPEYDELFAGDPTWVTESIGGMGDDGRSLVTKTSFRLLQTLYNLGPAPEPNLTIWYSPRMPDGFRRFASKVAIDTSSIQFESDELMRRAWGDDGAIACCVSPMVVGKQMQFFGARANLAKCLLYAINGGRDEVSGEQVAPPFAPVTGDVLDFDDVRVRFEKTMDWLARVYVDAMNVIHYMHDKYAYERLEMALHDYAPLRTMAFGMAGMSVVADSLSAIKYAKVHVIRDSTGLVTDYQDRRSVPLLRQQRQSRRSAGGVDGQYVHEQAAQVPDLPERAAYPVDSDHHVERRLREGDGKHAGRASPWRAVRPGGEPDARARQPRNPRVGRFGRKDSVPRCPGRYFAHHDARADRTRSRCRRSHRQSHGDARRVLRQHRVSHERECAEPRHAARRDGPSGEVSEPDDPRVWLRGELRAAHAGAADGRDQPDLPWRRSHYVGHFGIRHRNHCDAASSREFAMADISTTSQAPLEAKSPFELRVNLGKDVPDADVRSALATGDMGFLHSFTTGATVDGPGVRVVAWTTGCMWRCLYCHNPDTWTMTNGMPVTVAKAAEELRKYRHGLKIMSGGLTISGGEPLMQHRFVVKVFAAAKMMGVHTALDTNGYYGDRLSDSDLDVDRSRIARHQGVGSRTPSTPDRHGCRPDSDVCPPPGGPSAAGLGALRSGARADRRFRRDRADRELRRRSRQRRTSRRPAVPPDGPV